MRDAKSNAWIVGAVLLGAVSLGGCATKKFVREQVAVVDTKLGQTQSQVEAAQGQLRTQEDTLRAHDARLGEIDKTSREALERAVAAGKLAEGKFMYSMVLSDDSVKFPVNKAGLSPEAEARLTELATRLKSENKNVYVEIQGHTDASGSKEANDRLGGMRAEAVRKFLAKQGIALNRIATISYGEDEPVADNKSRSGRAQNRRVVVVVLS